MKVPDGGCVDERARTHSHTDIGRASRHEHEGRQTGVRMPVAVTREPMARSDRLSLHGWPCGSPSGGGHGRAEGSE